MRVLYDNLVETAKSLVMTNLDNDSFAEYLYDPYLELACNCTLSTSVITGYWDDAQTINCMSIGYHNCDFATLIFKDENGDELFNELIQLETGDSIYYVTKTIGVYSFEIQLSAGENVYVGLLSFGEYVEFSRFRVSPSFPYSLRSTSSKSPGGQIYGVFARQLRGAKIQFPRISNEERSSLMEYLTAVQTCKPHMIDLYPDAHIEEPPMYANIVGSVEFEKRYEAGFYYEYEIEYEEAR
jgi:hypothetical protein